MSLPAGLASDLFERRCACDADDTLRELSRGLRLFGEGLASMVGGEGNAFLSASDAVDAARVTLRLRGAIANERALAAARFVPPPHRPPADGCASALYERLLRAREQLRVGPDRNSAAASEAYSRLGDVLSFMARQDGDIMACVAAHQTITDAYALMATVVPSLRCAHRTKRGGCVFEALWLP